MVECAVSISNSCSRRLAEHAQEQGPREFHQGYPAVLVADDDEYMRDFMHRGLEQRGFTVWLADSGWQALDLYQQHGDKIAVVVLDVCMAGLDGLQTLKILQHCNPKVRACFMSGGIGNYAQTELLEAGAMRIFWKPFKLHEIAEALRQIIDENPVARSA